PRGATPSAAQEEMLKVPDRSPPVPQVSNTPWYRVDSFTARARMVRASPTISEARSPFMARATSSPPICPSLARPSMISDIAAAASSVVMSSRRNNFSISAENMYQLLGAGIFLIQPVLQKIPQDSSSFAGHDRFGVKLDAVHRPRAVPEPHDDAFFACPSRDFELARKVVVGDHQRVISR